MFSSLMRSGKALRNRGILGKKRKSPNRNYQLEALEDRQMLTAVAWETGASDTEYSVGSRALNDRPMVTVTADGGMNKVLVVSAAWTDTFDLKIDVNDVSGGTGGLPVDNIIDLTLDDGTAPFDVPAVQPNVPYVRTTANYGGTVYTQGMWVIPLDDVTTAVDPATDNAYNAMQRNYKVHVVEAGTSTDVFVRADIYDNVRQDTNGGNSFIKLEDTDGGGPGAPSTSGSGFADGSDSILTGLSTANPEDMLIDMFTGLQHVSVPMSLNADIAGGQTDIGQTQDWGNPPSNGAINMYDTGHSYEQEDADALDNMKWEGSGAVNPTDRYLSTIHSGIVLQACGSAGAAACVVTNYEFGDAPKSYGVAKHAPKGPQIGPNRDAEAASQFSADARGDDNLGAPDDEDGVSQNSGAPADLGAAPAKDFTFVTDKAGKNEAKINVSASAKGFVTAYVDFDLDGKFNSDEIVVSGAAVVAGANVLTLDLPSSTTVPDGKLNADGYLDSYMRVRFHTNPMGNGAILPPTGLANDGEVEDYTARVFKGAEIHGIKYHDVNGNGVVDAADEPWTYGAAGQPTNAPFEIKDGVKVGIFTDSDGKFPAVDLFGNPHPTITTNENGEFWFANLDKGTYYVIEDIHNSDTNKDKIADTGVNGILNVDGVNQPIDQGLRASRSASSAITLKDAQCHENEKLLDYITGSIHGVKFHDLNADGDRDSNEPWLKDIKFRLYRYDGTFKTQLVSNGKIVTNHKWVDTDRMEVSDIHGEFWFTHLDPGIYEVIEDLPGSPHPDATDFKQSTGQPTKAPTSGISGDPAKNGDAPSPYAFTITSGKEYVWASGKSQMIPDFNNDNLQSPGEIAYAAAEVALKKEAVADPTGPETQDLWFGNYKDAKITGFKYEDVNKNGKYDGPDFELKGVKMILNGDEKLSAITDTNGEFMFTVKPGTYVITESVLTDTNTDTVPDVDQDMVLDPTAVTITVKSGDVIDKDHIKDGKPYYWANYVYGSIHGYKFHDLNFNGAQDSNEPALAGIDFDLYKYNKSTTKTATSTTKTTTYFWDKVDTGTSDKHGEFWFTQLDPGLYEVVERPSDGFMQSTGQPTQDPNTRNLNPGTSNTVFQIVSRREYVWQFGATKRAIDGMGGPQDGLIDAGEIQAGKNHGALKSEIVRTTSFGNALKWGNAKLGWINGFKYEDVNNNGKYESNIDVPMQNVRIRLAGQDGLGNVVKDSKGNPYIEVLTTSSGFYSFHVKPGTYTVSESATTDTNGDGTPDIDQDMKLDLAPRHITLTSGEHERVDPFFNYIYGSIHGVKFHDLNANGTKDSGEPWQKDIKFDLYKYDGTFKTQVASGSKVTNHKWIKQNQTAKSDSHGEFWFTQLDPGIYEVVENLSGTDWKQSTSQPKGAPANGIDGNPNKNGTAPSAYSFEIISRREFVWEAGAASRAIDGHGGPLDNQIDAGEIQAGINHGALKNEVLATPAADPAPADQSQDLWFGNYRDAKIHGFKYLDVDRNGSYNANIDKPLQNVRINLGGGKDTITDKNHAFTNANGEFWFTVKPGTYTISESTATDVNGDGTPDNQQDMVLDDTVVSVTVKSGDMIDKDHIKAGKPYYWSNYIYGSIHGVKFHDLNYNGKWDSNESPLAGVNFDLYKYNGQTTKTTSSGKVVTTYKWDDVGDGTSNNHGEFWFTQLDPGRYEVVERQENGYMQSTSQATKTPNERNLKPGDATFTIIAAREYVWEDGAQSRPIDGMGGPKDGFIDAGEAKAGKNAGALKNGVVFTDPVDPVQPAALTWGNSKNAMITGFKYEDVNQNGKYDGNDVPLANVTMNLNGTDGKGKGVNINVKTGADGLFKFTVKPGSYHITESASTDTNGDGVADSPAQDLVLDTTKLAITVKSGEIIDKDHINRNSDPKGKPYYWSNYIYGSIHGVKFHDLNANGVKDSGEGWLKDVKFNLFKYNGTFQTQPVSGSKVINHKWLPAGEAITDEHGEFWFSHLDAGIYEVAENLTGTPWKQSTSQPGAPQNGVPGDAGKNGTAPSAYSFTIVSRREYVWEAGAASRAIDGMGGPKDGQIDANEVKAGINSGALKNEVLATPAADPAPADQSQDLWFGNYKNAKITGFKYEDVNKNGKYDGPDKPLPGVKMILNANEKLSAITDAGGMFMFSVKPGTYTITESVQTDTANPSTGKPDGTPDNQQDMILDPTAVTITVKSGDVIDKDHIKDGKPYYWANFIYGSIHGVKFYDLDGDGRWDKEDYPLEGIHFDLYKYNGATTKTTSSGKVITNHHWEDIDDGTTNSHGEFWFTKLDPGKYEVREDISGTEFVQTTSQPKGAPGLGFAPGASTFEIISRREYVWQAGAASRPVDGHGGPVDGFIDSNEAKAGYNGGALKKEYLDPTRLSFGNHITPASIHGFKFHDIDGDGQWDQTPNPEYYPDGGEPGLPNVHIKLVRANGDVVATTQSSDGSVGDIGEFWFDVYFNPKIGFLPGETLHFAEDLSKSDSNYNAKPDNQEGLAVSTLGGTVTVHKGDAHVWTPGASMGKGNEKFTASGAPNINDALLIGNFFTGSIHGFKFADFDVDGVYDPDTNCHCKDDVPFEWAKFELLDEQGNQVAKDYLGNWLGTDAVGAGSPYASSAVDGQFWIENLKPGKYTLRERLDLIDRNDFDRDGLPDFTDQNNDGLFETHGNGIPDIQEGLMASTPTSYELTIASGQEYAWKPGAAMLDLNQIVKVDADAHPNNTDLTNAFQGITLSGFYGSTVISETPSLGNPSTGTQVFGHHPPAGPAQSLWSWTAAPALDLLKISGDGISHSGSFSIDAISRNFGDIALAQVFDAGGNQVATLVSPPATGAGQVHTLTYTGTASYALVGGLNSPMLLDNLTYTATSPKTEIVVGTDLMFGNYYKGSIHGYKVHQGSGVPAPGIPFELLNTAGQVVGNAVSDANGEYWFNDVIPGNYTIREAHTSGLVSPAPLVQVQVLNGQTVMAVPGQHPTTGPWPENASVNANIPAGKVQSNLTLVNVIEGAIHGKKVDLESGEPIEGVSFELIVTFNNQNIVIDTATTDANGEYWFTDLQPNHYVVNEAFNPTTIDPASPVSIVVGSGEVYIPAVDGGVSMEPGQYQIAAPQLEMTNTFFGGIGGVVFDQVGDPVPNAVVNLSGDATQSVTTDASGRFYFGGLLPGQYQVVPAAGGGFSIVPVQVSSGEIETGAGGSHPLGVGQFETENQSLVFGSVQTTDTTSPTILDVTIGGTSWKPDFLAELDPGRDLGYSVTGAADGEAPLPFSTANRIFVQFSEDIVGANGALDPQDFALIGEENTLSPTPITSVSYNGVTNVATLVLGNSLPSDRYILGINADNVADLSGNDLDGGSGAGSDFIMPFNVSVADSSQSSNGLVDVFDLNNLGLAFGASAGDANYNPLVDSNGDGDIDVFDLNDLGLRFGKQLPNGDPGNPLAVVEAIFDETDRDGGLADNSDNGIDDLVDDIFDANNKDRFNKAYIV